MTVPQIIMTFLATVTIGCFAICWLILTREKINRAACRLEYRIKSMDEDRSCPGWANSAAWHNSRL